MNLLLDTSFLLELRRGRSKAAESLRRAAEGGGRYPNLSFDGV